jgi:hypothetical protein
MIDCRTYAASVRTRRYGSARRPTRKCLQLCLLGPRFSPSRYLVLPDETW